MNKFKYCFFIIIIVLLVFINDTVYCNEVDKFNVFNDTSFKVILKWLPPLGREVRDLGSEELLPNQSRSYPTEWVIKRRLRLEVSLNVTGNTSINFYSFYGLKKFFDEIGLNIPVSYFFDKGAFSKEQ